MKQGDKFIRCRNTDAGIRALATGCPQLLSLDMSGCDNITDEGIIALATGCPQLLSLSSSCCDNITYEGRRIAKSICKSKQY